MMNSVVPKRPFGKTGAMIAKLGLGGSSLDGIEGPALLDEALRHGVDFWESTMLAGGGKLREYFQRHPGAREQVFVSAKTNSTDPAVMQAQLDKTLADLDTSCVDFLAIHAVDNIAALNDDVRKWADAVKKRKQIRYFGFCTHRNMDRCLSAGADLGWIDGIQTFCNYRLRSVASMEDALRKCHEKGVGIIAVKSMGLCVQPRAELPTPPFNEETMSFEQAKLHAIWQNPSLTSVCSLMPNSAVLQANIAAALDERPLDEEVERWLADHAKSTERYFCRCCGDICESANADKIPIFNVMRLLLYSRAYGQNDFAAKYFAQIPMEIRKKMSGGDYSLAEKLCPQKMPIAQLMKEAYLELSR
jgi:predicted aldo/keto reductase-like oxidoreductase